MKKRLILILVFMLVLSNICFVMPRAESVSGDTGNSDDATLKEAETITINYLVDWEVEKRVVVEKGQPFETWIPEKAGYRFSHWEYTDENGVGTKVTNETVFYKDMVLRSYWEILPDDNHPVGVSPTEYKSQPIKKYYASIKRVKLKNNQLIVTVKKDKRIMRYAVKYSTSKNFSLKETKRTQYKKTNTFTLKGLKKGKTYYIQAVIKPRDATKYRAYASKIKKVKIK